MRKVERLVAALAVVTLVLPAAIADARAARPQRLRMDGYVGPPAEGQREMADLQMGAGRKTVRFQVTDAIVTGGGVLPSAIFARIRPYTPNLILRGPQDLISRVENAAPGDRLRIMGLWRSGVRDFTVASVETPPAEKPASP
jgi:hypothetical protein